MVEMRSCAGRSSSFQPSALDRSSARAIGLGSGRAFVENAVAHLGGGGVGEGDGDHLAGLVYLSEQGEEALGQQRGFAGAGGRLHQDGARGVERAQALQLVGRRRS
jgi:hypothetical protein